MSDGKFYWLKVKRDFFKRHDIRIIEAMPNGKDYILFYLKLLCESVDHEGNLRFSEQIPYNEDMLATITNTNIDIVRAAIAIFTQLEMMEILDDGTYFMREVEKMIGSAADNDNANRQRRFREKQRLSALPETVTKCNETVTECNADITDDVTNDNESKSKSKSKSIELDIKENIQKKTRFVPPTVEEVQDYCWERQNNVDPVKFINHYESNGWKVGRNPMKDWKAAVRTWEKNSFDRPVNNQNASSNPFTELKRLEGRV